MAAFDRLLNTDILSDAWKQILRKFSEGRLAQLMTLKPIEVYNTTLSHELDGAHLNLDFKAYVENVLQKRLSNAFSLFTLDFNSIGQSVLNYNCHVSVKVRMDYENMGAYMREQFANQPFELFDGQVTLEFFDFKPSYDGRLLVVKIPMQVTAKYKFFNRTAQLEILAKGKVRYQASTHNISIVDISYTIQTADILVKGVNLAYYPKIIAALEDFMQFNIEGELKNGLELAKGKVQEFSKESSFVSGEIETLELERIVLGKEEGFGVFLAEGKIKLMQS